MRRILITGAGSYIGTSVEQYLMKYQSEQDREDYHIDTISLREESWENYDFSSYHTVFHVAGIAHADVGNVTDEKKTLYYSINCDLAVKTALKARSQGVGQFIYMSSVIVYGDSAPVGQLKRITAETKPAPSNFYGDSKWQAEQKLAGLETHSFHVAILRPPMIYGRGSKGNYPLLSKLARRLPIFPDITNERSILYVENLGEFVRLLIEAGGGGLYFPQNEEYGSTADLVSAIGKARGKRIQLWKMLNPFVRLAAHVPGRIGRMVNKAFGSLSLDLKMSRGEIEGYCVCSFQESIERTEA